MSTAAVERRAIRERLLVAPALVVAAAAAYLLAGAVPDVTHKPWHEDEAVAGLIAARPLPDVLHTVLLDRGGAPLHFVLAHVAFAVDGSPRTLRWLSLVFALATIPLCYDLARRLAGRFAGLAAAALTATSQLLGIYATFGRMYSLFAFAGALALDLFVRAVDRPTRGTLAAATAAALLPILVHPFGVFVFGAELAVALWLWRIRALPVALLALPLVLPYLRLPGRYDPEVGMSAPEATLRALAGSAGGWGVGIAVFAVLAAVGAWTLPRTFTALGLLLIAAPPMLLAAFGDKLSPRHLIFVLPVWTTFVATGLSRMPLRPAAVAAALGIALLAPAAVADPRTSTADVTAAATWVRTHVRTGDALYPYSPVFLAALPRTALALPREPVALERILRRTHAVRRTLVAIPNGRSWSLVVVPGPFTKVPPALAREAGKTNGIARAAALQLYLAADQGFERQRSK
ncbi:MAG TPA: glycosyltransferase family 39 protein [Gaiellaceae bacterium]|nr:glycosyltransferase family 39 protein [Gaiellaceae bacterium]